MEDLFSKERRAFKRLPTAYLDAIDKQLAIPLSNLTRINLRVFLSRLADAFNDAETRDTYNFSAVIRSVFKRQPPLPKRRRKNRYRKIALAIARHIDEDKRIRRLLYHNRPHPGKVVVNAYTLAMIHNKIARNNNGALPELSAKDIRKLVIRAAAHDLGHDGKGNQGMRFRLEHRAILLAYQLCKKLNLDLPKGYLNGIYGTDVRGYPRAAHVVRWYYDYYTRGGPEPKKPPSSMARLMPTLENKKETVITALLHDADVLTSLLSREHLERESAAYAKEIGRRPSVKGELYFMERILGERVTTHAAEFLLTGRIENMVLQHRAIITRAKQTRQRKTRGRPKPSAHIKALRPAPR